MRIPDDKCLSITCTDISKLLICLVPREPQLHAACFLGLGGFSPRSVPMERDSSAQKVWGSSKRLVSWQASDPIFSSCLGLGDRVPSGCTSVHFSDTDLNSS